ncbi:Zn-dependent hydrolase [Microbacterium sp. SZ1]|uniref:MBL fold metallo-hydrolase n=1 Tax=Microbacterium sp. SZ1 TaxID=1849736 RepID=UPI000BBBC3FE|nr:MBL fold metallo-hydrolase [Microbacterium sp. SZ1]PCE15802.1 Zn-dependent hydrolase [Microbacterium sp. SZ1]
MSIPTRWTEVVDGVHRLETANVNCYLVVTAEGMTLVDAGLPGTLPLLDDLLAHLGAHRGDIDAVILTHAHFDHVGMAHRLVSERRTPVHVHPRDQRLARHPYRYAHERARITYPFRYPKAVPTLLAMTAKGALGVRGIEAAPTVHHATAVEAPGRPIALWSPGHTEGHCGFWFEDLDVLMTGDAIVTLDPYTGGTGPRIVAGAATADSARALSDLDALLTSSARTLLPGHGEPWHDGAGAAVTHARRVGRS